MTSSLFMMMKALRRSSFVYFHVSFKKKKKLGLCKISDVSKFWMQKISEVIFFGLLGHPKLKTS